MISASNRKAKLLDVRVYRSYKERCIPYIRQFNILPFFFQVWRYLWDYVRS